MRIQWHKPQQNSASELLLLVLKDLKATYGLYALGSCVLTLLALLPPKFFLFFSEKVPHLAASNLETAKPTLIWFVALGLILAVGLFVSRLAEGILDEWMTLGVERLLKRRALGWIQRLSRVEAAEVQRGDWLMRLTTDLRSVEQFLTHGMFGLLRNTVTLLAVTALLTYKQPAFAVILLISAAFLITLSVWSDRLSRPAIRALRSAHGEILQTLIENFEGFAVIRSYAAEGHYRARFEERFAYVRKNGLRLVKTLGTFAGANASGSMIITTACLSLAAWSLSTGEITIAEALAYPFYLGIFQSACMGLAAAYSGWSAFRIDGERLAAFLACEDNPNGRSLTLPTHDLAVLSFDGVILSLPNAQPLTKPFSLSAKRGEILLVRGPSGCGKSTLAEALVGLRPLSCYQVGCTDQNGHATLIASRFDNAATEITLPIELGAYVEQHPTIFSGTLLENLQLGRTEDLDPATAWRLLGSLRLTSWAESIGGLGARLADQGRSLSEGQRYRIGMARALLSTRPFLVLDEPFAALDPEAVHTVCTLLHDLRKTRGIIIVSHVQPVALHVDRLFDFAGVAPTSSTGVTSQRETTSGRTRVVLI